MRVSLHGLAELLRALEAESAAAAAQLGALAGHNARWAALLGDAATHSALAHPPARPPQ